MIYIIRHGQTDWNIKRIIQGKTNIPLNDFGRSQAKLTKEEIDKLNIDICITSSLDRAIETANILLDGRNINIIHDERLNEMCFGELEGMESPWDSMINPMYTLFYDTPNYLPKNGGETVDELFSRVKSLYMDVKEKYLDKGLNVLFCGHGVSNSALIAIIKNIDKNDFLKERITNLQLVTINN